MDRCQVDRLVAEELEHIPRGSLPQNALRAAYNAYRRHDLSMNQTTPAYAALWSAATSVKQGVAGFVPQFDHDFFVKDLPRAGRVALQQAAR